MIPETIRQFLEDRGVRFHVETHPPRLTAPEVAASAHVSGKRFAKAVLVCAGERQVLVVVPADARIDLPRLGRLVGEPVELAPEGELARRFPDCETGAMPPLGVLYALPVIADVQLSDHATIAFNGGTHTDVIEMRWEDFAECAHPQLASLSTTIH